MPREGHEAKARRYLGEARLVVRVVSPRGILATCRGAGETYRVEYLPNGYGWRCECPAQGRCAHIFATMLVTDVSERGGE